MSHYTQRELRFGEAQKCSFCKKQSRIQMISGPSPLISCHFDAQIECGHCGARGSRVVVEKTRKLAEEKAIDAWDAAAAPMHRRLASRLTSLFPGMTLLKEKSAT